MPQESQSRALYGGQAVIEGVMFAGKTVSVTAVRRKDNTISYLVEPRNQKDWAGVLRKIPFIRGIIGLIDSIAKGSKHLNYSAEMYAEDEATEENHTDNNQHSESFQQTVNAEKTAERSEPSAEVAQGKVEEEKKSLMTTFGLLFSVAIVGVLSFVVGKLIFTLIPATIEQFLFGGLFANQILHNLIEGVIKIIFLLAYIIAISQTPLIKRLFQYHGAEHKVISAYEAGKELNVANVQRFNTLHYRCGSSFMVLTVLIGVVIYSFMTYDNLWERIYQRILLLPVVLSVSYEALRVTNAVRDVPVLRYLGYPGLWLQLLTTKQPTDDQVEVAIASFQRVIESDQADMTSTAPRMNEPT